jgi:hypothetical protein
MKERIRQFAVPVLLGALGMGLFDLGKTAYQDHQQLKAVVTFLSQATAAAQPHQAPITPKP